MTGLCEGGNEPPGSLKASKLSFALAERSPDGAAVQEGVSGERVGWGCMRIDRLDGVGLGGGEAGDAVWQPHEGDCPPARQPDLCASAWCRMLPAILMLAATLPKGKKRPQKHVVWD
ncbi:hypothetical protein ANN_21864 [Periplaneta americana]|uniref:Uncharacterized protein n=1 Tax=Periplaneta americana TaxID=6978 RepID=A0ABQ8S6T8_PERAM|nr:hypothetical protein ANN_21864 [Periplaneta americana]